jgi:hypothetical protein
MLFAYELLNESVIGEYLRLSLNLFYRNLHVSSLWEWASE